MAGVTAELSIKLAARQTGVADLGTPALPIALQSLFQFQPGTTARNQANTMFSDTRTLASAATENLDLAGSLLDAFGAVITNAEVVLMLVSADPANTTDLTFFGAAATPFNGPLGGTTPSLTLGPGETVALCSPRGYAVGAGASDLLKVQNASGAAANYNVVIIGRTALVA